MQAEYLKRTILGAASLAHRRSDKSIRDSILRAIAQASWLEVEDISVVVEHGEVQFAGSIPEPRLRAALREIARRCRGVRSVDDSLRVVGSPDAPV
jgi:osmotically-inducible protein OsmY